MKKYMGNKKGSTFILSSDDCGDWLVCSSGDSVSVRTYQRFQTGESYIQGDIYLAKRSMMTIMDRSVLYQINSLEKPQKISGFLKEKGYSRQNLVDLRKNEQAICLNGTYVHMNHMLAEGDVLTVWIRETDNSGQIRPVKLPFVIVYEDEDLLVINKPAGMPVHPSRGNPENSLGNALAWYFKEQGVPFVFRCINRLDRDTSGLTIVAKHAVSAAILGQMVRAKAEQGLKAPGIHRTYLALVEGKVMPVSGVMDAPIARKEDRCLRRVVDFKRGDRAVTHYRVLTGWQTENAQKFRSLVKLQLETGRTHQIRVHMAYLGHPLVGDFLYNPAYGENQIDRRDDENSGERQIFQGKTFSCGKEQYDIGRQALHAWKLSFPHPMTGQPMNFMAPLPKDMQRLIPEEALPSV
ncbi:MAG: RluA family pseudouridine synthase [Eubacterium sp.]